MEQISVVWIDRETMKPYKSHKEIELDCGRKEMNRKQKEHNLICISRDFFDVAKYIFEPDKYTDNNELMKKFLQDYNNK